MGIPVARIELLDEVQVDAINQYSNFNYPLKPTLFFEFHGTESWVQEQSEMVKEILLKKVEVTFNGLHVNRNVRSSGRHGTMLIMQH